MKILVTGGLGFLGSHISLELFKSGYEVIVIDNLSNSKRYTKSHIDKLSHNNVILYEEDLCNKDSLRKIFKDNDILAVIHLVGLKGLDEATKDPIKTYRNNVSATVNLIEVMKEFNCKKLVFASTSDVYGKGYNMQIKEDSKLNPENILGESKYMCEKILKDTYDSDNNWSIAILRLFNPAGADESGLLGNDEETPSTLIPRIVNVATGGADELLIYGNDYDTKDGTARRDYVHVSDIAKAYVKALEKVLSTKEYDCYNIGTGYSHSVLDVIKIFETVNNVKIKYRFVDKRDGDAPVLYASPDYTLRKLGWQAEKDLGDICIDSYNYVLKKYLDKEDLEELDFPEEL